MKVAVLGATGLVGQKAVALLQKHPYLTLAEVSASSVGKAYHEVVSWREPGSPPDLLIKAPRDLESPFILSALPTSVAKTLEPELAARGHRIFTNASAHRMSAPLIIPEINGHLLSENNTIIANSNCTVSIIALALYPLLELAPIEHVSIVTMQAISGAGSHYFLKDNLIPNIPNEEEKIVAETHKILETDFPITVHVNRVPVSHGHTVALHVHFSKSIEMPTYQTGPYLVHTDPFHPQPADLTWDDMRIHVGRLKLQGNTLGLIATGHNLVRGAAGAAIANIERFIQCSLLFTRCGI